MPLLRANLAGGASATWGANDGGLDFDQVLADVPLWSGTERQKNVASFGFAQTLMPRPAVAPETGVMGWLREHQTAVMIAAAGLVGLALLRPGGRR